MHDLTSPLMVELLHLVNLMAPPFKDQWRSYCWAKAVYLSESNPADYATLPQLLKEAMQPKSSSSEAAGTLAGKSSTGGS